MKRLILMSLLLAGCATQQQAIEPVNRIADRPSASPVDVGVDWSWVITGDAQIRPIQVFANAGYTYLQMSPNYFASKSLVILVDGQVVPYRAASPYLIVTGIPSRLDMVTNGYRVVVKHGEAAITESTHPAQVTRAVEIKPEKINTPTVQPIAAPASRKVERVELK